MIEEKRKEFIKKLVDSVASDYIKEFYYKDFENDMYPAWDEFDCYAILGWSVKISNHKKAELVNELKEFCSSENLWIFEALSKMHERIFNNKKREIPSVTFDYIDKWEELYKIGNNTYGLFKYLTPIEMRDEIIDMVLCNRLVKDLKIVRKLGDKLKYKNFVLEEDDFFEAELVEMPKDSKCWKHYKDSFYGIDFESKGQIQKVWVDPFQ